MRRKALATVLVAGALAVGGCGEDEDAQVYAKKLGVVLKAYHEQVNQKAKAERESYKHLAALYGRAQDEDVRESLWLERTELAERIADRLQGRQSRPSISEVRTLLKKYAETDFQLTRKLLEREAVDNAEFLATLETLQIETKKIEALTKALDALAEPKSKTQQLKDLAAYAGQVDSELKKLTCADLTQQVTAAQEQKKAAEADAKNPGLSAAPQQAAAAKVKTLTDLVADLEKRKTASKCA